MAIMRVRGKALLLAAMLFLLLCPLRASQAAGVRQPVEVPVLCYHHLIKEGKPHSGSVMTVAKFERDMAALKARGYEAITFRDLYNYTHGRLHLPPKPIMITFDDGYLSNSTLAFPILKKMEMKATIFVIGWCVGKEAQPIPLKPHFAHFSWEKAEEMRASGIVEIECHTYDLHDVGPRTSGEGRLCGYGISRMFFESDSGYIRRLNRDFDRSFELHKKYLRRQPLALSYPFGCYDASSEAVAKKRFMGTMTVRPGIRFYSKPEDLYAMPRILVNERVDVLQAIDSWELQPWQPLLSDKEADLVTLPDYIGQKIRENEQNRKPKRP